MKFTAVPFLRYSFFLVLGILIQIESPYQLLYSQHFFLVSAFTTVVLLLFTNHALRHKLRYWLSTSCFLCLVLFGISIASVYDVKSASDHISFLKSDIKAYKAILVSEPEFKTKSVKTEMRITSIKLAGQWQNASGKLMVYFANDSVSNNLKYGDLLLVNAKPDLIEPPKNPYEFNLKRFYGFKGITHRQFLKSDQFIWMANNPENRFIEFAIAIRRSVDAIFTKYIPTERERNIASALILGIKNELDDEIQYAYAATGTMHVLAVSGLHVGIIYGLLVLLTGFLLRLQHGKIIQSFILFILIWLYALVTGLCPSVLRAVAMLSLVIISNLISKKANVFNTLFVTVFILLCINPFMLMEVGFQLSFIAVLGIVYLYPKMYQLIEIKNKPLNWIWEITVMSICAQLATFPLGLLYFHQFPNLFLLSNLIVIPFAIVIMYVGLGFTALSFVPIVATYLGFLVEKMVWVLNQLILYIEQIPNSLWLGIHISVFESWLIYAIIVAFVLLFVEKEIKYMNLGFCLVFIFCGLQINKIFDWQNQKRIIVYNVNKGFGIDLVDGRNAKFICDSLLPKDRSKMQFHILNHRWAEGIRNATNDAHLTKTDFGNLFISNKLTFCQISKPLKYKLSKPLRVDYLIVSQNATKNLYALNASFIFKTLIIDGSNKSYLTDKLLKQAQLYRIEAYSTGKSGAFIIDL
ncbi:MAG: ComEC/Rec2 family competence protein [Cytophagales bacterium]